MIILNSIKGGVSAGAHTFSNDLNALGNFIGQVFSF